MKQRNKQIERIQQMEQHLDCVSAAVRQLNKAIELYAAVQPDLQALSDYYGSPDWKQDIADDRSGHLPPTLKRGVLSEDAVWNLLEECQELNNATSELCKS